MLVYVLTADHDALVFESSAAEEYEVVRRVERGKNLRKRRISVKHDKPAFSVHPSLVAPSTFWAHMLTLTPGLEGLHVYVSKYLKVRLV